ncbi:MAG: hypothetical protein ACTHZ9_03330 [Leucobacter sp.]
MNATIDDIVQFTTRIKLLEERLEIAVTDLAADLERRGEVVVRTAPDYFHQSAAPGDEFLLIRECHEASEFQPLRSLRPVTPGSEAYRRWNQQPIGEEPDFSPNETPGLGVTFVNEGEYVLLGEHDGDAVLVPRGALAKALHRRTEPGEPELAGRGGGL